MAAATHQNKQDLIEGAFTTPAVWEATWEATSFIIAVSFESCSCTRPCDAAGTKTTHGFKMV